MSSNDWKEYTIQQITESVFSGGTPSTIIEEYWNGNYNWLSSGETKNKFITNTDKKITEEGIKKSSTKLAKIGDIVIASAGQGNTRGQASFCCIDTYINQSIIAIRSNKKLVDPSFLFYNISARYKELRQISDGHSIRGSLTTKMINKLKVKLPILDKQKLISKILLSLDQKIEINNKINENLQSISQLLFKHWFVDFEFPNEEGLPYKFSGGEMVDSELGMIPKGWEVKKMQEVIDVRDGTHASPKPKEDGYPLITSKYLSSSGIDFQSANLISQEDYDEINKRSKVDTGDILITMIGTVGNIYKVDEKNINFAIKNVGLFKTSNNKTYANYIYLYLKSDDMKQYIKERLAGSTQQYISLGELRKIPVIIPYIILQKFNKLIEPILQKITEVKEENNRLTNLRDTLLPKLMNGEIDLSNIEIEE